MIFVYMFERKKLNFLWASIVLFLSQVLRFSHSCKVLLPGDWISATSFFSGHLNSFKTKKNKNENSAIKPFRASPWKQFLDFFTQSFMKIHALALQQREAWHLLSPSNGQFPLQPPGPVHFLVLLSILSMVTTLQTKLTWSADHEVPGQLIMWQPRYLIMSSLGQLISMTNQVIWVTTLQCPGFQWIV